MWCMRWLASACGIGRVFSMLRCLLFLGTVIGWCLRRPWILLRSGLLVLGIACAVLLLPSYAWSAPSPAPYPSQGGQVQTWVCERTDATVEPSSPALDECAVSGWAVTTVPSATPAPAGTSSPCPPDAACVTTLDYPSTQIIAGGFTLILLLLSALLIAQLRSR